MNPYVVPGLEARPDAPLCPHDIPEHEFYYVPVDKTQDAFEQFQEQMGDLRELQNAGRLVVVSGPPGCGKTALINRCATWLRDGLGHLDIECMIFPLVEECQPNQSIKNRMNRVFQCILNDMLDCGSLTQEDHRRGLKEQRDDLAIAYRYLSGILKGLVAIVLLPPSSELVKEVAAYAQHARENIVFFVESSPEYIADSWPDICEASRVPPIRLDVGLLRDGDGWRFVQARQECDPKFRNFRKVSEDTVARIMRNWWPPVGQLQKMFYRVYREANIQAGSTSSVPSGEMTYHEFTDYHLRSTRD